MKRFIRGMGAGMLISAFIVLIAYNLTKDEISNEEIIKRAKLLGLVEEQISIFETKTPPTDIAETEVPKQETNEAANEETDEAVFTEEISVSPDPTTSPQIYNLFIESGNTSEDVSKKLFEAGIIEDQREFNTYLVQHKKQHRLRVGIYEIQKGITYDEIMKKITK